MGVVAEYFKSHDPRGAGVAEITGNVQATLDRWHQTKFGGAAAYGAKSAKARVEADIFYTEKNYDTNRATTATRDNNDISASTRFFYKVLPKTSLVLEGRVKDVSYDTVATGGTTLDSTTSRALVGVKWDSTYKTTGLAQIGLIRADFDANTEVLMKILLGN